MGGEPVSTRGVSPTWSLVLGSVARVPRDDDDRMPSSRTPPRGGLGRSAPEFAVLWFVESPDGPRALNPIPVPDEESARICIETMPAPIVKGMALRIERRGSETERTTVIAYRDRWLR